MLRGPVVGICAVNLSSSERKSASSFTIVVESCLGQHRALEIHREISKFIDSDEYNAQNSSDQLYKHGGAIPGRGLSHTVPYHKVNDRLDKTGSKISKHSGQLSSSGRMSVMDQIRADRANGEKGLLHSALQDLPFSHLRIKTSGESSYSGYVGSVVW